MNYTIRKTKIADMQAVESAHRKSIIELCSKDYTPEQIDKYSNVKYTPDRWEASVNNDYHICVEVDGVIEGMCHSRIREDGHGEILGLYFTKAIAGNGIGREIVEMAFEYFKKFNPAKIVLTGTVTAKPFYVKLGFREIKEKTIILRGVEIECFEMEKEFEIQSK